MEKFEPVEMTQEELERLWSQPDWEKEVEAEAPNNQIFIEQIQDVSAYFVAGFIMFLVILAFKKLKPHVTNLIIFIKVLNFNEIKSDLYLLRKIALYATVSILTLMTLFPPWSETTRYLSRPLGYYFILLSPDAAHSGLGVKIDFGRLLLQWLIVLLISGAFFFSKLRLKKMGEL